MFHCTPWPNPVRRVQRPRLSSRPASSRPTGMASSPSSQSASCSPTDTTRSRPAFGSLTGTPCSRPPTGTGSPSCSQPASCSPTGTPCSRSPSCSPTGTPCSWSPSGSSAGYALFSIGLRQSDSDGYLHPVLGQLPVRRVRPVLSADFRKSEGYALFSADFQSDRRGVPVLILVDFQPSDRRTLFRCRRLLVRPRKICTTLHDPRHPIPVLRQMYGL